MNGSGRARGREGAVRRRWRRRQGEREEESVHAVMRVEEREAAALHLAGLSSVASGGGEGRRPLVGLGGGGS